MRLMYVDVKEKNILGPFKVRSKCGVVSEVSIQSIVFQQDPHERFILPRQEAAVQNVTPRAKQMAVRLLMQVRGQRFPFESSIHRPDFLSLVSGF